MITTTLTDVDMVLDVGRRTPPSCVVDLCKDKLILQGRGWNAATTPKLGLDLKYPEAPSCALWKLTAEGSYTVHTGVYSEMRDMPHSDRPTIVSNDIRVPIFFNRYTTYSKKGLTKYDINLIQRTRNLVRFLLRGSKKHNILGIGNIDNRRITEAYVRKVHNSANSFKDVVDIVMDEYLGIPDERWLSTFGLAGKDLQVGKAGYVAKLLDFIYIPCKAYPTWYDLYYGDNHADT